MQVEFRAVPSCIYEAGQIMECASHAGAFAARSQAVDEARLRPPKAGAWLPHSTQVLGTPKCKPLLEVDFCDMMHERKTLLRV